MPTVKADKPKASIAPGLTLPQLAKELKKWTEKKKKAKAEEEFAGSMVHLIATEAIPPLMDKLEQDEFNVPGVGRIELRPEVYPSVKKENIPAFYAALRKAGHGALIVEYVFPPTLKAFATEQLEAGIALPAECTVALIPTAKLLKARIKGKRKA